MNERKLELIRQDIERAKSLLSSKNREEQYKFIKKAVDAWSNKKCDISKGLMELKKYQQDNIEKYSYPFFSCNLPAINLTHL